MSENLENVAAFASCGTADPAPACGSADPKAAPACGSANPAPACGSADPRPLRPVALLIPRLLRPVAPLAALRTLSKQSLGRDS